MSNSWANRSTQCLLSLSSSSYRRLYPVAAFELLPRRCHLGELAPFRFHESRRTVQYHQNEAPSGGYSAGKKIECLEQDLGLVTEYKPSSELVR